MTITLIEDIPCSIPVTTIQERLGIKPDSPDSMHCKKLADQALRAAAPRAVVSMNRISIARGDHVRLSDETFASSTLAKILSGQDRVFPFIATIGSELDSWPDTAPDVLRQLWIDEIKRSCLDCAVHAVERYVSSQLGTGDIAVISPGSLDNWPVTEQKKLFALFGPYTKTINITLNEYSVMMPVHSLSGIFFSCPHAQESCSFCLNMDCTHRKAPPHKLIRS